MAEALVAPASFSQERLWLDCQLQPEVPLHNLLVGIHFDITDLTADDFATMLKTLVARHETFRTSLELREDQLMQVVAQQVEVSTPPVTDLSKLDSEALDRAVAARSAEVRSMPLPLDQTPLWRAELLWLGNTGWYLLLAVHHTIYDGGSAAPLMAELHECAAAIQAHRRPQLPELEIQYADFAAWQREVVAGPAGQQQLSYWRDRLDQAPSVHGVPLDRPRPAELAHAGKDVFFDLPVGTSAAAAALGRRHGATEMMVLFTAYVAVLAAASGRTDVVVGIPAMGRERAELRPLIGMFVNTLVIRIDTSGEPSFADLLMRVRDAMFEAWEHQDIPFQVLVNELAPARVQGARPLFQLGFNHLKADRGRGNGIARDELMLVISDDQGRLEYRADLFDRESAERLTERYALLLQGALAQPQQRLPELPGWQEAGQPDRAAAAVAVAGSRHYPLSPAQERLWLAHQLTGGDPVHHLSVVVRLQGTLALPALQHAIDALVARHDAVRATFTEVDGAPAQLVAPPQQVPLPLADLRDSVADADRLAVAREMATAEARGPFDPTTGPLLRVRLLRLADDDHFLLLTMHQIVADLQSLEVIKRELGELYQAYLGGTRPQLPDFAEGYGDLAARQRQRLTAEQLAPFLTYWTEQLAGAPKLLELPTEQPRPAVETFRGDRHTFALPPHLGAGFTRLCAAAKVTAFEAALAVLQVTLARYSSQTDIVVGTQISGRDEPGAAEQVGRFADLLALRGDLTGNPSFRQLLRQARQVTRDGLRHQRLPFEQLVAALQPDRSLSHEPVFQVQLTVPQAPADPLALPGLVVTDETPYLGTTMFDLSVEIDTVSGDETQVTVEFPTDLFSQQWARRFGACLTSVLAAVVADANLRIFDIDLLPPDQYAEVVSEPNRTHAPITADCIVPELVTALAAGRAVTASGESVPLPAVGQWAAQLATVLTAHGVGPEVRVGVCLERSAGMLASLAGVWRAGGAYVPLDPAFPPKRLRMMVADADLQVIITDAAQHELVEQLATAGIAVVAVDGPAVAAAPAQSRPVPLSGDNLAYVIYTSGSTGRPKGVQVPHRPLANMLYAFRELLQPDDTLVAVTTLSFDISVLELLLPLLRGARLVIADHAQSADGPVLRRLLAETGATALQATPATWQMLTASGTLPQTLHLRLCGGDVLPRELADQLANTGAAVWNLYGPTETTVWSGAGLVSDTDSLVTAGWPIANTQLYVLDRQMLPVPIGVVGEVFIGGTGVARGYHRQAALTAQQFLPDPFAATPGARIYRTGDLARRLPDGRLEILGRVDNQVKVRGFRIEVAEIEDVLAGHPSVRQAVVTADSANGDTRLVAYIQGATTAATADDLWSPLRLYLRERLPDYMLPSALMVLPELPLTANGKVDRRGLPAPNWGTTSGGAAQPPRTDLERELCELWAKLLPTSLPIGIHDDFFRLGGHSLGATRLVARIRHQYGSQLSLREVFAGPTVAELAAVVLAHPDYRRQEAIGTTTQLGVAAATVADPDHAGGWAVETLLRAAARERERRGVAPAARPYTLSPLQRRLWFLHVLTPDEPTYTMHALCPVPDQVDVAALQRALDALVLRHDALRTTFAEAGAEPVQLVSPTGRVDLHVVDLRSAPEAHRQAQANETLAQTLRTPFDLTSGPLLRVVLVRLYDDAHALLLHLHHIIADGSSLAIMWRDLRLLYQRQASIDAVAQLPSLTIGYADYATAQDAPAAQRRRRSQCDFWRHRLAGAPALLELPTDRPRPATQTFRAGHYSHQLSADSSATVRELARAHATTPHAVLLTAFQVLLSRHSGQSEVLIGTPLTLRPTAELEQVVGLFVNTVVARAELSGNPTLGQALAATKADQLAVLDAAEAPFDQVIEALAPPRSAAYQPLFQVMFVYQDGGSWPTLTGRSGADQRLDGLAVALPAARYDLTMSITTDEADNYLALLDYNADLFDLATVQRMARHFTAVITAFGTDPATRVWDVPLLDPQRQRQLLTAGTQPRSYPPALVTEMISDAVARAPLAPAIIAGQVSLSYGELSRRADQLAAQLAQLGVGPEARVGLALPAGADGLIGLLGILRAGAAYVPVNPEHPPERISAMLADSAVAAVVTTSQYADRLPAQASAMVHLDQPVESPASAALVAPTVVLHEQHAAYVIYTSGSTGRPKGVVVTHAALRNLTRGFVQVHGFGPTDRLLMIPPLSFDASVGDIFPALATGATLVLHPDPVGLAGKDLLSFCRDHGVTAVDAPSALWQQWVEDVALDQEPLPATLSQVMVGGESVPTDKLRAWACATGGRVPLVNHYGPTEATVCATTFTAVDESASGGAPYLPIGTPLANVRCYVLDVRGGLAPDGVAGELCIGGVGLARGYLGQPGMTAERFVPDPYDQLPGARMYRTGDRARWVDGQLEFLGRVDAQVKVRGHRVEPAEVEAVLASHPQVREAAVVAKGPDRGTRHLVGYVVAQPIATLAVAELHSYLRERLPEYLVPGQLVLLGELPLTPHGKVDHAALPEPDVERVAYEPPVTDTERALAQAWQESLQPDASVGRHDNFFALGGHSLLVPVLASRFQRQTGRSLPVRLLFQAETLAALAAMIDAEDSPDSAGPVTPDLHAEAVLPDDVCAAMQPRRGGAPQQVLITGATGFLGAFLLEDLLRHTDAQVHCLVRASSQDAALQRVERNLRSYELWRPEYAERIRPVIGDLSQPRLGLTVGQYHTAAEELDAIYHNGGMVDFLRPYETLRPVNVAGTVEVLRLAGTGPATPVHFISTLGVFLSESFQGAAVNEDDLPSEPAGLRSGYNQSKWVADALVRQAAERGLPVTIHRPARITGDSRTGVSNPDDYFSQLLKTYVQMASVPLWESGSDMSPVDHVAATVGHISRTGQLEGSFHYYNQDTVSFDEIAVALRRTGYRIRRMPYPDWHRELLSRITQGEEIALAPYAALLTTGEGGVSEPTFDCTRAQTYAAQAGAPCPPADADLIVDYLTYFIRSGFLTRPDGGGHVTAGS